MGQSTGKLTTDSPETSPIIITYLQNKRLGMDKVIYKDDNENNTKNYTSLKSKRIRTIHFSSVKVYCDNLDLLERICHLLEEGCIPELVYTYLYRDFVKEVHPVVV